MRRAALLTVIAVFGYAANAQFTLMPLAGVESPSTKISYNNSSYFKPQCQSSAQFGLRGDYRFKGGFGPFVGLVTHRPAVSYQFNDPVKGLTDYTATNGDMQVQMQAGVQYSSKPIRLSKKSSNTTAGEQSSKKAQCTYYSKCGKKYTATKTAQKDIWTLRLQPSTGIGYVPSNNADMKFNNSSPAYTYNAGNVNTEFIGGMGFEFARNKKKFLTLNVNYFQGLKNSETSFTTVMAGGKEETTVLKSKVSGWNASLGVPISFTKKPAAKKSSTKKSSAKSQKSNSKCNSYYRVRCGF